MPLRRRSCRSTGREPARCQLRYRSPCEKPPPPPTRHGFLVPAPQSSIGMVVIVSANLNADTKPDLAQGIGGPSPALAALLNTTLVAPRRRRRRHRSSARRRTRRPPSRWPSTGPTSPPRRRTASRSTTRAPPRPPLVVDWTVTTSQFTAPHPGRAAALVAHTRPQLGGHGGRIVSVRRFTPQASRSPPAPAALSALSVSPASVTGGTSSQGRQLTSAAPTGGFAVALSSGNPATATVPASVSVAQGATTATFAVATSAVTTSTPVTITASAGSVDANGDADGDPSGAERDPDGDGDRPQRRAGHVEPGRHQRRRRQQRLGVIRHGDVDHAERHERPRRHLVRGLLQRREQAKDLHVHHQRKQPTSGPTCSGTAARSDTPR